jgi:Thrombospondin type 3 repeat
MTFHRRSLAALTVALIGFALLGLPPGASAADEATYTIAPSDTDPAITDPPPPSPPRGDNLVWLAPEHRRVGKLLVFLPTGGATNLPSEFTELGTVAGQLGYHTIILAYRNEAAIAAMPTANPPGCGNAELQPPNNTCARQARLEILDGGDESSVVNVDRPNSIENRLNKLLVYLKDTYPEDGWAQFVTSGLNPGPVWSETVIAGSSLGAGEALMIAQRHDVYRAALLHGWVDARYDWVKETNANATPSADYFTLIHQRDAFFARTCFAYLALGLTPICPLAGFPAVPAMSCLADSTALPSSPLWIENLGDPPFNGLQVHVFNLKPGSFEGTGDYCHQSTSRNGWIARDGIAPSHILANAWSSVLGDETDGDGIRNVPDNCPGIANPDQADADADEIGDVCDKDRDGDTVANATDNCPDTANGNQVDADGDGIGDVCDPTPRGTIPPTITVAGLTVNATGPAGTLVNYTATATDDLDPDPTPVCTPSVGSLFAIGNTPLACSATDASGNAANASFVVKVLGAKEQLTNLIGKVVGASNLPPAIKTQLTASLQSLAAGFDPNKPLQRAVACLTLRAFTTHVRFVASPAQTAEWTADANRIRAVLAC